MLFLVALELDAGFRCMLFGFIHNGDKLVPENCIFIVNLVLEGAILPVQIGFFIFLILSSLELSKSDFSI